MLNRILFEESLLVLLEVNNICVIKQRNDMLYKIFQYKFEDKEFESICMQIIEEEKLYGSYPTPEMFFRRKWVGIPKAKTLQIAQQNKAAEYADDPESEEFKASVRRRLGELRQHLRRKSCKRFDHLMDEEIAKYDDIMKARQEKIMQEREIEEALASLNNKHTKTI